MQSCCLLPGPAVLCCEQVTIGQGIIVFHVGSMAPHCPCPRCGRPSARVHSRYLRTLSDLPWQGRRACVRWRSRKIFCDDPRFRSADLHRAVAGVGHPLRASYQPVARGVAAYGVCPESGPYSFLLGPLESYGFDA
ncbi:MAG: transposase family protein [Phycisphaeraceae bacterium]|nr:transposase family protein [Phycisphaeraceae bacterium]